jgi:hypothetical protein
MTTCAECLATLATDPVSSIPPGSDLALHSAVCPDCARTLEELRYAERQLRTGLASSTPSRDYVQAAMGPLDPWERLNRKRIGRRIRFALFLLTACFVGGLVLSRRVLSRSTGPSQPPDGVMMETIALNCLTPSQASELVTPYLRSSGSAVYSQRELGTITIRGIRDEFIAAKTEIERFDSPDRCSIPATPLPLPSTNPAGETPGKD